MWSAALYWRYGENTNANAAKPATSGLRVNRFARRNMAAPDNRKPSRIERFQAQTGEVTRTRAQTGASTRKPVMNWDCQNGSPSGAAVVGVVAGHGGPPSVSYVHATQTP